MLLWVPLYRNGIPYNWYLIAAAVYSLWRCMVPYMTQPFSELPMHAMWCVYTPHMQAGLETMASMISSPRCLWGRHKHDGVGGVLWVRCECDAAGYCNSIETGIAADHDLSQKSNFSGIVLSHDLSFIKYLHSKQPVSEMLVISSYCTRMCTCILALAN